MEPIRVAARRGGTVESLHRVHAVAVRDGEVVVQAGDASLVTFLRSSAKPLQALPLVHARSDLDDRLVAIASASHHAEPAQIEAVRELLAAAPATEDDLECGEQEGRPPGRIHHNCSGKHAGMLAVCHARGWEAPGYVLAGHPVQREILSVVTEAAEAEPATGTDGCGVVSFALPLERMAAMFARLEALDGGARVVAAMRAYPGLIGGDGALDTRLMLLLPGWTAKRGAEGLLCGAGPDGTGFVLKVEDGNMRALPPAVAALFARLGHDLQEFESVPVEDGRGEVVGEVSCL
jgi:L-asparaginase II